MYKGSFKSKYHKKIIVVIIIGRRTGSRDFQESFIYEEIFSSTLGLKIHPRGENFHS